MIERKPKKYTEKRRSKVTFEEERRVVIGSFVHTLKSVGDEKYFSMLFPPSSILRYQKLF